MIAYTKLSPHDLAEIVHDMVMWYVDDLDAREPRISDMAYGAGSMVSFTVSRWLVETAGCKRVFSNVVFDELDLGSSKKSKARTVAGWKKLLTKLERKYREHNDCRNV